MNRPALDWNQIFTLPPQSERQPGVFVPRVQPRAERIEDPFDRFPLRDYWLYYLPRPLAERRHA